MGIRVGRSNPKPFDGDASINLHVGKQKQTYTEDERKALVDSLMRLPKDKIIPALRSAGLDKEADEVEQKFAQEHLGELRKEKVAEIMALPEEERIAALLDAGFNEEAAAESKRQAEAKIWSAVITLLNQYKVIDITDEATHAVLEKASTPEMGNDERVLFLNENGLEALSSAYMEAIGGKSLEDIEAPLKEAAKEAAAAENAGEGTGEGTGEGAGVAENPENPGTVETPDNGEKPVDEGETPTDGTGNATETEKKKVGRPPKAAKE